MLSLEAKALWEKHFKNDKETDFAGFTIVKEFFNDTDSDVGWKVLDFGDLQKPITSGKYLLPVSNKAYITASGKPVFTIGGTIFQVKKRSSGKDKYEIVKVEKDTVVCDKPRPQIEVDFDRLFMVNKPILERLLGSIEVDEELLYRQAFTAPSFSSIYNQKKAKESLNIENNISLATLGDGIIKYVLTAWLYQKKNLIKSISVERQRYESNENLNQIGILMNFSPISILPSSGNLPEKTLANIVEALIGVIYLKFGIEYTSRFIHKYVISNTKNV